MMLQICKTKPSVDLIISDLEVLRKGNYFSERKSEYPHKQKNHKTAVTLHDWIGINFLPFITVFILYMEIGNRVIKSRVFVIFDLKPRNF